MNIEKSSGLSIKTLLKIYVPLRYSIFKEYCGLLFNFLYSVSLIFVCVGVFIQRNCLTIIYIIIDVTIFYEVQECNVINYVRVLSFTCCKL